MNYYIIAGEASGDLHAANLMKELKKKDPDAHFRVWGGDRMEQQGATLVKHINELAFMGFVEVLMNIRTIIGNLKLCKKDILDYQPHAVILIDYPGFNLRIARFCKQNNIRTIYYISPQVWAWNKSRVKNIRRDVDKMLVILPFEKEFYAKYDYDVDFTGHPLLDALEQPDQIAESDDYVKSVASESRKIIALLPGSRKQEILRMLPVMGAVAKNFPNYQFVVAGTSAHKEAFYKKLLPGKIDIPVVYGQTYHLLRHAEAALVTSGTATLETALIGTPQVVCYRAGSLSYYIAKRLVDIKYISLVNLIMDKEVVRELIQSDFNIQALSAALKNLTESSEIRKNMMADYDTLRQKLGGSGASAVAASLVYDFLME